MGAKSQWLRILEPGTVTLSFGTPRDCIVGNKFFEKNSTYYVGWQKIGHVCFYSEIVALKLSPQTAPPLLLKNIRSALKFGVDLM